MKISSQYFICALIVLPSLNVTAVDIFGVYAIAEENDPIYRQAVTETLASQEEKSQARALLLPSAGLNANSIANDQSISTDQSFGVAGETRFNSHLYALNVTQPLFRWDRFLTLRQTESRLLLAEAQQLAMQQQLIIRVAERYFAVLSAEDNLEFAKVETKALERKLAQTKQRFEVGLTAITDLQEAQAGFDRATADEILMANLLDNAREDLREITGEYLVQFDRLQPSMPLLEPEPNDVEQWAEIAKSQNMDVIASQHTLEHAHQEIKIQKSGHYPTLDLVASHGYNSSGGRFASRIKASSIGLDLNIPIFQGGLTRSKTKEAGLRYKQSLQALEQAQRAAHRQARQSYTGIISGISRVNALKQAVISSETALRATEVGFEVGTRTAVDVVTSERAALDAKRNYAQAKYDYLLNGLRLKRAAGTLNANDLKQIDHWLE